MNHSKKPGIIARTVEKSRIRISRPAAGLMKHKAALVILLMITVLFAVGVQRTTTGDAKEYVVMVEVFRGNASFGDVGAPWRNRILVPFLASFVPFGPKESMQVVNYFFAIGTGLVFFRYLKSFSFNDSSRLLGTTLFMCSVPFVGIGTQALTDMGAMFLMILALLMMRTKSNPLFIAAVLSLAVLTRETALFLVPVYYIFATRNDPVKGQLSQRMGHLVAGTFPLIAVLIVRLVISAEVGENDSIVGVGYYWMPDSYWVTKNVDNLVNILDFGNHDLSGLSFWLSIVPLAPFLMATIVTKRAESQILEQNRPFLMTVGFFLSLIPLYGFLAAVVDARYVWAAYPVLVPLALIGYDRWDNIRGLSLVKKYSDIALSKLA
jgi:hypothetical protein